MQRVFYPAVALMKRMNYTTKFMVLWLVSLAAITVVIYNLFVNLNQIIVTSQQQLDGIVLIKPIFRTTQFLQQYRGFSAAFLGGDHAMRGKLAAKEIEVYKSFKEMEEKLPPDLTSGGNFWKIKTDLARLREWGLRWTIAENFAAHSSLIEQMRSFGVNVADEYALTTKSEIDSFYLVDTIINKLPDALDHFGQIRGYSSSILSRKQISEEQRLKLNSLTVELRSALAELDINFRKISHYNPALQRTIPAVAYGITGSVQLVSNLVTSDIIAGRFAMPPNTFMNIATTAIDNGYMQLYESLLPTAEALIKARIDRAENTLRMSIAAAVLLLLVVLYFSVGIYYAIIGNIQSLSRSAHAFANGDLSKRVKLDTRDELSQVGDSFNEMADGFSALLEANHISEGVIWRQANFDTLTALPNRRMFYDRLEQEIKKASRDKLKVALLFIDLDKFKEINDTRGHDMGDILLTEAAHRITDCVRETDTVARLGGDEFTVIMTELDNVGNAGQVAENIRKILAEPFLIEGDMVYISASIGITLYPVDAVEIKDLLKNADQAMYAAKNNGHDRFEYFTLSMQEAAQARLRLTNELRYALAAGQIMVYYQPIVELVTGRIHKAEALIRWQHPVHGMVSPVEFIPLAEESGLIIGIGDWVFKEAVRQVKRWRTLHDPTFQVSVNVSPTQFRQSCNSCAAWFDYLQELALSGQSIVIEITEGLLLDAEPRVTDKLLVCRNAGIQVAIDDFGTGYSSLSYLKKFNIDYLKIDQSFTRNLAPGSSDMALSEAIIVMAHKLGLKVIAEGVETEQQRDLLAAAGCDYGQGYLFSRPMPVEEFNRLLEA